MLASPYFPKVLAPDLPIGDENRHW